RPNQLFLRSHFYQLHDRSPFFGGNIAYPVVDQRVSICKPGDLLHGAKWNAREVVLVDFPDGFAFRIYLADVSVLVPADQRIGVVQADGRPGRWRGHRPELLAILVVLHDLPQVQVATKNVPALVTRACRNCPWVLGERVSRVSSFSILLWVLLMTSSFAGFPFCMINTRSVSMG